MLLILSLNILKCLGKVDEIIQMTGVRDIVRASSVRRTVKTAITNPTQVSIGQESEQSLPYKVRGSLGFNSALVFQTLGAFGEFLFTACLFLTEPHYHSAYLQKVYNVLL